MQTSIVSNPSLTTNLGTAISTILPTPSASTYQIVSGITLCNKTNAAVTVNVTCYNGTTDVYLAYQQTIGAYDTMTLGGDFFKAAITPGFSLRALCNTASAVDVCVFYLTYS
jgi:hypothetical protein